MLLRDPRSLGGEERARPRRRVRDPHLGLPRDDPSGAIEPGTDITATLVLSPKTVRNHVSNIFAKLQVRDRAEAIVRAREAGMGGSAGA